MEVRQLRIVDAPHPRRSVPPRWLVPVALVVALVAIIVAVVAVLSRDDDSRATSESESAVQFEYFTQTGKAAQRYARVRLDYGPGQTVSDHVGTFVLLPDDKGTWQVCTAFLLSTTGVA